MADDKIFDAGGLFGDFKAEMNEARQELVKELKETGKNIVNDVKEQKKEISKQLKNQKPIDIEKVEAVIEKVDVTNLDEASQKLVNDVKTSIKKATGKNKIKTDIEIEPSFIIKKTSKGSRVKTQTELEEHISKVYNKGSDASDKKFVRYYSAAKELDYNVSIPGIDTKEMEEYYNELISNNKEYALNAEKAVQVLKEQTLELKRQKQATIESKAAQKAAEKAHREEIERTNQALEEQRKQNEALNKGAGKSKFKKKEDPISSVKSNQSSVLSGSDNSGLDVKISKVEKLNSSVKELIANAGDYYAGEVAGWGDSKDLLSVIQELDNYDILKSLGLDEGAIQEEEGKLKQFVQTIKYQYDEFSDAWNKQDYDNISDWSDAIGSSFNQLTSYIDSLIVSYKQLNTISSTTNQTEVLSNQTPLSSPVPEPSKVGEEAKETAQVVEVADEQMEDSNEKLEQSEEELAKTAEQAREKAGKAAKDHADEVEKVADRIAKANEKASESNRKIIGTMQSDNTWSRTYQDQEGRTFTEGEKLNKKSGEWESFNKELTSYTKFESDAISITNKLADAYANLDEEQRKATSDASVVQAHKILIDHLEKEKAAIDAQAEAYFKEQGLGSEYIQQLYNERVSKKTDEHAFKLQIKTYQQIRKENEANLRVKEKEQKAIDSQYSNNVKSIETYTDAQDKLNNLYKQQVDKGSSNALTAKIEAQKEEVEKLEQKAIDAGLAIETMFKAGSISQEQMDDALKKLLTGSDGSSNVVAGAEKDKDIKNRYNKNLQSIKDYINAKKELDNLNSQLVKNGNAEGLTEQIDEKIKEVAKLEKKANDAKTAIWKMLNAGEISPEDDEKARKLKDSGTTPSNSLSNALNAEMLKHQSEIDGVRNKYEKLGMEASEIDKKLQSLKSAFSEVTNSATKSADIRIQKELEYKEVLTNTQKALLVDTKNSKEDRQSYDDNLKIIKEYSDKRDYLNKLLKDQVKKGESQELTNEIKIISEEVEKLAIKADDARKYIQLLFDVDAIDKDLNEKAGALMDHGSDISSGKLLGALDDKSDNHSKEIAKIKRQYESLGLTTSEVTSKMANLEKSYNDVKSVSLSSVEDRIAKEKAYQSILEETKADLDDVTFKHKGIANGVKLGTFSDFESAKQGALEYASALGKVTKELQYSDIPNASGIHTMTTEIQTATGEVKKLVFSWKDATSDMTVSTKMLGTELKGLPGLFQEIGKKAKQLAVYWAANAFNPMDLLRYGRTWFDFANQYDDAVTNMMKVSKENIGVLQDFQKESFKLADAVGTTADQLQNSTVDFLRLGESLEEAKQSAQVANILFNVSEFENIDDATGSLISMSQAYDELDKMEIIDKLNIVGNNYAISTNELALALQNSASALKVAGNDMDEAIALATAANTVVQDYSKVSAGIRTVSMRITGATAEELQEAGEDTEGLIETTAKLEEQVKSLTAVNGKMGVSLLDANGNFRSTYEILLDIARVWDEIGAQDKLDGNNRQNVLLESLAGKNRASILAAILDSPEILESVYNTSANDSNNSAQEELNKQLESISGHVARLQNQWQNLWAETANRDVINFFLDFATTVLKVADDIGVLNVLLFGGGGLFAAFKSIKGEGKRGFKNVLVSLNMPSAA